jgi:hypothetical protein
MPSCADCPSFLEEDEVVTKFRKNIGAPVCAKYGHVLGRPGADPSVTAALQQSKAAGCDSYGEARPVLPVEMRFLVALPDAVLRTSGDPALQSACNTCGQCSKFIREDAVLSDLGWVAGLCAARGKLILGNRQSKEAENCEYRQFGPVRTTTSGVALFPEFDDSTSPLSPTAAPVSTFIARSAEATPDPQLYETDKEVSEDEQAAGIRAWRAIVDPDNSEHVVYLPIYRLDFFTEEEQKKIPKYGDDEHPELYQDHFGGVYACAVAWMKLDDTPCAWGEAGVGKTELFRFLAYLMSLPFERMSITAGTELDELMGRSHYDPARGTYFEYGRLPKAWCKPCVLVLDEPNTGPVEVWQRIRPLTDNSKQLVMDEAGAESLDRDDDCYMGLAMNPAWDPRNIGALPIADPDVNRLYHIFIDMPDEATEKQIIAARVRLDGWELTPQQMNMLMKIARDLREHSQTDTLPISWGIRPQIKVARALAWFEPLVAYRRAVGDYLEPKQLAVLRDVVNSHTS